MRENDWKIHPTSENSTLQFLFMKLNALSVIRGCFRVLQLSFSKFGFLNYSGGVGGRNRWNTAVWVCGILSWARWKTLFSLKLLLITLMMQRCKLHLKYMCWLKKTLPTSGISGVLIYDLALKESCLKLCCSKTSIIKQLGWITWSPFAFFFYFLFSFLFIYLLFLHIPSPFLPPASLPPYFPFFFPSFAIMFSLMNEIVYNLKRINQYIFLKKDGYCVNSVILWWVFFNWAN